MIAVVPGEGWRPMASVPKDAYVVLDIPELASGRPGEAPVGRYTPAGWRVATEDGGRVVVRLDAPKGWLPYSAGFKP